jgi:hypothetical protein
MLRFWIRQLRRPAIKAGSLLHTEVRPTRTKNAQFVSFLAESGFRKVDPDRYEKSLRRRRMAAVAFIWAIVAGFAWVVIESAQALSLF